MTREYAIKKLEEIKRLLREDVKEEEVPNWAREEACNFINDAIDMLKKED